MEAPKATYPEPTSSDQVTHQALQAPTPTIINLPKPFNTQYTETMFSRLGEIAILSNSYEQTQNVKMGKQNNMLQMKE